MSDHEDIDSKAQTESKDSPTATTPATNVPFWKRLEFGKKEPTPGPSNNNNNNNEIGYGLPGMPNEIIRKYQLGVEFRGKIIGSDTVPSAKGDSMCHMALAKLKAAVIVSKQHKPRLVLKITDKELRLLDQDTRTDLHIHKLYKISYIVSDPNDRRAFGYIYGEKEGPWTFYGIKTEGPAISVIIAIKELFEALASKKIDEDDAKKEQKKEKDGEADSSTKKTVDADDKNAKKEKQADSGSNNNDSPKSETTSSKPTLSSPSSVENMLLDIQEISPAPQLKPRLSNEAQPVEQTPPPAAAPAPEAKSDKDLLSDLFSLPPVSASPSQANPFVATMGASPFMPQQPVGYFPPAGIPPMAMSSPYGYAGFPPQQPYYGQPMPAYANVPGFGFSNPMQAGFVGRFPVGSPMQQAPPTGFGQPMQTAPTVDSSLDATSLLTPQVAANAPVAPQPMAARQAPRMQTPSSNGSDSWSFVGTGLPPRQDSGLFSEFLPGELENTQQNKSTTNNYVPIAELAKQPTNNQ